MVNIKEFFENQEWIFAKTYEKKAPHEYIVRGQCAGTDEDFMDAVMYIQEHGQTMRFWNWPNKYIYLDGKYYWVMTDNMVTEGDRVTLDYSDSTAIINRSTASDYIVSIRWKGLNK